MPTRRYETVFILPTDLEDSKTQEILERLDSVLERSGGVLVKREDWGVRKLAYVVNRHAKGRYFLLDFVGSSKIVAEVERHFKMMENILRFLTIKKADAVDMEAIRKEQQEEREKEEARKASALQQAAKLQAEAALKAREDGTGFDASAPSAEDHREEEEKGAEAAENSDEGLKNPEDDK